MDVVIVTCLLDQSTPGVDRNVSVGEVGIGTVRVVARCAIPVWNDVEGVGLHGELDVTGDCCLDIELETSQGVVFGVLDVVPGVVVAFCLSVVGNLVV